MRALFIVFLSAFLITVLPKTAFAYTQACQLVNKMAGIDAYQRKPLRVASMTPPDKLPKALQFMPLLDRHGSWFIYQTNEPWYSKTECAPLMREGVDFMPVLLNKKTGRNAVLTGTFLLKVFKSRDLKPVIERYDIRLITLMPKADTAIVDVRPTDSYDELILKMDIDKDVQLLAPVFSEPRW